VGPDHGRLHCGQGRRPDADIKRDNVSAFPSPPHGARRDSNRGGHPDRRRPSAHREAALRARGPSPRPVVLDSSLRTPPSARLLERRPILFAAPEVELPATSVDLKNKADIVHVPDAPNGHGRSLQAVLDELHHRDIASIMVEGGGRVLSSFLGSHLADFMIITVAPTLFGSGVKAYSTGEGSLAVPVCVGKPVWTIFDGNAVLSGEPAYPIPRSFPIKGVGAEKP
jgi:riboflavin biosynthesis pyrimidine reductase